MTWFEGRPAKNRWGRVNRAALRVAGLSTLVALVGYAILAGVVAMAVTSNLTSGVDTRLTQALTRFGNTADFSVPVANLSDPGDNSFGPPLLVWLFGRNGSVQTNTNLDTLPVNDQGVKGPTTVSLFGVQVRLAGENIGSGRLIVGQNIASITQTQNSIVFTELWAGVGLLIIVFGGALITGRRVGIPIEMARQRQMEFTADASHELRTPLAVIDAQASLALAQVRTPEWYQAAFTRVKGEGVRMRKITEDLLFLARVDQGGEPKSREPVEVGVVAEIGVARFGAVAEAKGITLTGPMEGQSGAVAVPAEWLDRLLGVLLDNACKYAPAGGVVEVKVEATGNRVKLVVEDSGPGIAESERGKIFQRFHRAIEEGPGAGLGLAIADAVVSQSGGKWEIGKATWGGASMGVSWPRALGAG